MLETLWTERQDLRARAAALSEAQEAEYGDLQDRCFDDLEAVISNAEPRTLEDAAIQARLLAEYVETGHMNDDRDLALAQNLAAGLERMVRRES